MVLPQVDSPKHARVIDPQRNAVFEPLKWLLGLKGLKHVVTEKCS